MSFAFGRVQAMNLPARERASKVGKPVAEIPSCIYRRSVNTFLSEQSVESCSGISPRQSYACRDIIDQENNGLVRYSVSVQEVQDRLFVSEFFFGVGRLVGFTLSRCTKSSLFTR